MALFNQVAQTRRRDGRDREPPEEARRHRAGHRRSPRRRAGDRRRRPLRPVPRRHAFRRIRPRKLNAGGALLTRAVLAVSGATDAALTAAYRRHGDLGAAAFDLLEARPTRRLRPGAATTAELDPLTLADVAEAFAAMAAARTTASAPRWSRARSAAPPARSQVPLKLMLGDMRIGVKQSLVEEAIAMRRLNARAPVSARAGPPRGHARSRPRRRRRRAFAGNPQRSPHAPLPSARLHARLAGRQPGRSHRPLHLGRRTCN